MNKYGMLRVSACSAATHIANPRKNLEEIKETLALTARSAEDSDIIVFNELGITGYSCGELFYQPLLIQEAEEAIRRLSNFTRTSAPYNMVHVGAPVLVGGSLYNCDVVMSRGEILGIKPKENIPNTAEFYESRYFRAAVGNEPKTIRYAGQVVPFGTDLLFEAANVSNIMRTGAHFVSLVVCVDVCQDLWEAIPPSSYAALNGANLCVNLSASNELVAKNVYRASLIANQSARCLMGYAYSSSGPSESTSDLVFGGDCIIAENGEILARSARIGDGNFRFGSRFASADIDMEFLCSERAASASFGEASAKYRREYRRIKFEVGYTKSDTIKRFVDGFPFVPRDTNTLQDRCAEVTEIQMGGLYKRLSGLGFPDVYIGVSGGWDSTLSLLTTISTYKAANEDLKKIHGITMPGFGTSDETLKNALELMELTGVSSQTIDIREAVFATFRSMGHKPFGIDVRALTIEQFTEQIRAIPKEDRNDVIFENAQSLHRMMILRTKGFVVGTNDLSESAEGWTTYGDQVANYNVNCAVPKTLMGFLIRYMAEKLIADEGRLREVLLAIADTTISPELLMTADDGKIDQSTEAILGPYAIIDFAIHCFNRKRFSPDKIMWLSGFADWRGKQFDDETRFRTIKTLYQRFFAAQFKRNCVPDGPKVGQVSYSPRGDWRMPSDVEPSIWINSIEGCDPKLVATPRLMSKSFGPDSNQSAE